MPNTTPPTGKDDFQKWFMGQIATGKARPEDISQYFAHGGSVDQLIKLVSTGSMSQQLQEAQRGQREQLGLRTALLGGEQGTGPNAIQAMTGQQGFNPFAGPQQMPQNPMQGIDFRSVFGMEAPPQADPQADPQVNPPPDGLLPPTNPGVGGGVVPMGGGGAGPLPVAAGGGAPAGPLPGPVPGAPPGGDHNKNLQAFLQAIKGGGR